MRPVNLFLLYTTQSKVMGEIIAKHWRMALMKQGN